MRSSIPTLSFKETKKVVKTIIKSGRVPFIWGPPGIGKSTIGRNIASEMNLALYPLDAPLFQSIDYQAPVPNHETKTVEIYRNGFLPEKGPALILIEDLPHAKPYQQIPIMQMVLDKRIGYMSFSNDVYFIATGNREEDLAGTNPLPSPLLNRMIHINMAADFDEWEIWAKSEEIHEDIIGFIKAFPAEFSKLPEEGKKAFPTPRSWHMFSDCLKNISSEDEVRVLAEGTVGGATAGMFMAYRKYLKEINPVEIIEKEKIPLENARDKMFAITQSVTGLLKKKGEKYIRQYKNGVTKFFSWLPGEFKMAFLKEMVTYSKGGKPDGKLVAVLVSMDSEIAKYSSEIIKGALG